jgi:hypothetical protein
MFLKLDYGVLDFYVLHSSVNYKAYFPLKFGPVALSNPFDHKIIFFNFIKGKYLQHESKNFPFSQSLSPRPLCGVGPDLSSESFDLSVNNNKKSVNKPDWIN